MDRRPVGKIIIALLALALAAAAGAQDKPEGAKPEAPKPEGAAQEKPVDPQAIWPATLERIAGRYVFVQVASPGGLWDRVFASDGRATSRQISINEAPAAFRDRLTHAELVISDLKLPTSSTADERTSPSGRGKLRYFDESTTGRLTMKGLPGIGGAIGDAGEYSGPVAFALAHQAHSNPSVSGVFQMRAEQERTWGAATLDYAALEATAPPAKGEEEGEHVIENARILRSGREVFAFVEWTYKDKAGDHGIIGSVRLARANTEQAPAAPANTRPTRKPAGN